MLKRNIVMYCTYFRLH